MQERVYVDHSDVDPAGIPTEPDMRFVYFIQGTDGGPVKIGVALDPDKRLRALQIGYPYELRVLKINHGGYYLEQRLHALLAEDRLHGEWFKPSATIDRLVREPGYIDRFVARRPPATAQALPDPGPYDEVCGVCGVTLEYVHETVACHLRGKPEGNMCAACIEAEPYRTGEKSFEDAA